jgi:integrase
MGSKRYKPKTTKNRGIYKTPQTRNFPNGGYEVRYHAGPRSQRRKVFRTQQEAIAWQRSVHTKIAEGSYIDPRNARVSFGSVVAAWEATLERQRKAKTVLGYKSLLETHVLPEFEDQKVGDIAYSDVERWVTKLAKADLKPGTIRNAYRVLKMVLDQAVKERRILTNPCSQVNLPKVNAAKMLHLTAEEVATLAEAAGPPPYCTLIRFAAYTGLRAGEIAALKVGDIDFKARTLRVSRTMADLNGKLVETEPKTEAGKRTVGIPAFILEELRAYLGNRRLDHDAHVFTGLNGGQWRHGNFYGRHFRKAVNKLVDAGTWPARLRPLRFHDLRHTYASILVEQGAHPKLMSEAMGHSSINITLDRYAHLMPNAQGALAERLDSAYASVKPAEKAEGGKVLSIR